MTKLTGENFVGIERSAKGSATFFAENPANKHPLEPFFHEATKEEINRAVEKAESAFLQFGKSSGEQRAILLETIADEIKALGDTLIKRASEESGLPIGRITGERGRTMGQLKLFASVAREGSWVDARIDHAQPDRTPMPKVDIRSMERPLGPVGIFGASNFPLAFSVAGGDTASAIAAGCTVVAKAHPAHPGTCELIASAITTAIQKCNMPDGTFSLLHGTSHEVGMAIVKHPLIKAVGFTGSLGGGKALFDAAQQRPEPIPVYAEMGSTNPVFVLPKALANKGKEIAEGLAGSVTLGVGQFCTNPGLVIHETSPDGDSFDIAVANSMSEKEAGTMLTEGIQNNYQKGVASMLNEIGVKSGSTGKPAGQGYQGIPHVLHIQSEYFLENAKLEEEVFGPSTLIVKAKDKEELRKIAQSLGGHLTATIFAEADELSEYSDLIDILQRKVGRVIINNFPTGVEVCHSMVHGGPFPATTNSRSTSVGTKAITRFSRPVCYQNFPDGLLPEELQEGNPMGITRMEN